MNTTTRRAAIVFGVMVMLSSCATLFNSRNKRIEIFVSKPATVVLDEDTLDSHYTFSRVEVPRQRKPLHLKVSDGFISKDITIRAKNSLAFWSNLGFLYGVGMLVDFTNPKRFTYPGKIYIDMDSPENNFATIDSAHIRRSRQFKFSPLKLIGFVHPGLELSYERPTGNKFSTQFAACYLFASSVWEWREPFRPNTKGFGVGIEEKWYYKKAAPMGNYLSAECSYLQCSSRGIWRFGIEDIFADSNYNNTNYVDTFLVKKKTISFHLKFGRQVFFNNFFLDFSAGLGLRYRSVIHEERIDPSDAMEAPYYFNAFYVASKEGRYWIMSLPLNVRIGWLF
ncbi:MAG: hypothetical protein IT223_03785 [Crocinitomicaceae bacterium]|nr:hypothetical protein [Crocinitomicaceae bacterium]